MPQFPKPTFKRPRALNKPKSVERKVLRVGDVKFGQVSSNLGGNPNALLTDEGERLMTDEGEKLVGS